jgi:uncharacterized protein YceK
MILCMKIHKRGIVPFVAIIALTGCASVSQQEVASQQAQTKRVAIAFQRQCDAHAGDGSLSLLTRIRCISGKPLPPECEASGTDHLMACRDWAHERTTDGGQPSPGFAGFVAAYL